VRRSAVAGRRQTHAAAAAARPDPVRRVAGDGGGRCGPLGETAAEVGGQVAETGGVLPEAARWARDGRKDDARRR